jgi:hypothetical protein
MSAQLISTRRLSNTGLAALAVASGQSMCADVKAGPARVSVGFD